MHSAVLQEDGGQWVVGMILEGAALEDKRVYLQMLSKWRSTEVDQGVIQQLEEVRHVFLKILLVSSNGGYTTLHRWSN